MKVYLVQENADNAGVHSVHRTFEGAKWHVEAIVRERGVQRLVWRDDWLMGVNADGVADVYLFQVEEMDLIG